MQLLEELKRRRLFQTAALYIAVAWGGTEILTFLIEALWGEPPADTASKYLAILFIAGFPVAMYLAWTRDLQHKSRRVFGASALAIVLVAGLVWLVPAEREVAEPRRTASDDILALAVLPLENLSAEPGQEYFALGMTEALIAELSQLRTFKVISRTSVMQYIGTTKPLPDIADELGVDAIVEGSVYRAGNQVRITAQLIEAATDHHLWADSFEGDMQDVLVLQNDTARAIATGIGARLDAPVTAKGESKRVVPQAYDAYLQARLMVAEATGDGGDALRTAEQVIELDPAFAPGYALLADLYGYLALTANVTHGDAYLQARQLARKAVELDPELAYARIAMARVQYQFEWDWEAAEAEFVRALELDSNSADGLALYGSFRVLVHKDCDGGLALIKAAIERDPFNPGMHFDLGVYNFHCRRPDDSIRHLERSNELAPSFVRPRMIIAWNLALKELHEEAADRCDSIIADVGELFDAMVKGSCSWVYSLAGQDDKARQELEELRSPPPGIAVDPFFVVFACIGLDDTECALAELEKALRQRSSNLIFLRIAPGLDPLRDNARFKAIIDQMNFPDDTA